MYAQRAAEDQVIAGLPDLFSLSTFPRDSPETLAGVFTMDHIAQQERLTNFFFTTKGEQLL